MIVILMGVTGSGKSAVGHALANATGWHFADGDDFHSEANKAKMGSGTPLTDEDREPWLASLHGQIMEWVRGNVDGILACSALKASYRARLTQDVPEDSIRFVYLNGTAALIRKRLEKRQGHYMPEFLLPSQLATLELPRHAIEISIAQTVPAIVDEILFALVRQPGGGVGAGNMLKKSQ